jgi:RHS repeat-associated protein
MNIEKRIMHLNLRHLTTYLMMMLFAFNTCAPVAISSVPSKHVPPKAVPSHVNRGAKTIQLFEPKLTFSEDPTDLELTAARVFTEPLIPISGQKTKGENIALANALSRFKKVTKGDDVSSLTDFISQFPHSRWTPSVQLNLGMQQFASGCLSEALVNWKAAWDGSKTETGKPKAIADEAIAQLVLLEARLGRKSELESCLAQVDKRRLTGTPKEMVHAAMRGDTCMTNNPGLAYKCGPYALDAVLSVETGKPAHTPLMLGAKSTAEGTNLAQLKKWSDELGLHYQLAKRSKGSSVIVPSVMHWKLGHFAAITKKANGRYQTQDQTFGHNGNIALSDAVVDEETDGYFLVPNKPLPAGWQPVTEEEAKNVWGKGYDGTPDYKCPNQPTTDPPNPPNPDCHGMAQARAYSMQATLNIQDIPVGYVPPVGPKIDFLLNYNDEEDQQPSSFSFSNLGPDWSFGWLSYITFDESGNATLRPRGGGAEIYNYNGTGFDPGLYSQAQLTNTSTMPLSYARQLPDGSQEIFNQTDGSGRVFMTQVIDPKGQSATVTYDSNFRITAITDAIGQVTTISYGSDTSGEPGFYVITQIMDPFARSCTIAYDSTYTYLQSITDVIGLVSQFHYDQYSLSIDRMTTPYGTTGFSVFDPAVENGSTGLQFLYPDGTTAVLINEEDDLCTTYYWDREAMSLYPSDFVPPDGVIDPSHSVATHWCFSVSAGNQSAAPLSITKPLENATTFAYPGGTTASGYYFLGGSSQPATITRITSGTETQIWQYEYNSAGNITVITDPVGRQFTYTYDSTLGIDLLEKQQTQTSTPDINGMWTGYVAHGCPSSREDGSGQVTSYTYNDFNEPTTLTDANGDVWTKTYDTNGYLTQIDGPLLGSNDVTSFSYDGYGRIYQVTDSEGYSLTHSYDDADRLIEADYPDGTSEKISYDKLDAVLSMDRNGRWTQHSFDSMDRLAFVIDPLGRKTEYSWCSCGSLSSLTDANGNTTLWKHDLEGRAVQKTYQDGSPCYYSYDSVGRLSSRVDALGQNTAYTYNLDNSMYQKNFSNAVNATASVTYSYDSDYNRLTSVEKDDWGTISYSYNPYITDPSATTTGAGRVSEITNNVILDSDITYTYDVLGRVANRSINGDSNSTTWVYDPMGRVSSETDPLGEFDYGYVDDATGYSKGTTRLSAISYPNGQVTNFNWFGNQGDQRLQGIINLASDGTCLSQFGYGYDPAGEITAWQQQLGPETNRIAKLGYDLAGQLVSSQIGAPGSISPTYQTQSFYSYDAGGNRIGAQKFAQNYFFLYGSTTAGDTVNITVSDAGLSGGQEIVSYTVQSGDGLTAVATGLAAAINADSALSSVGVDAGSSGVYLYIYSASTNETTYSSTSSGGATEFVSGATYINTPMNLTAVGSPTDGDALYVTVNNPTLSGGSETVSYTVESGDTLTSIAEGLSAAINADSNLSSIGVSASNIEGSAQISAYNFYITTYTQSVSDGATESIVFSLNTNVIHNATVGGTATPGDVLTLTVYDSALTAGSESVTYTVESGDNAASIATGLVSAVEGDSSLSPIMEAYTDGDGILRLESFSLNPTSYRATTNSGATETVVIGINDNGTQDFASFGGCQFQYNNINELVSVSPGGVMPFQGTANKALQSASVSSNVVSMSQVAPLPTTYTLPQSSTVTESLLFSWANNGNLTGTLSGTVTTGDVVSFVINNALLPGGQEQVSYTVMSGDSVNSIASGLTAAVNSDTNLANLGISAAASSANISISQPSTSYSWGSNSGATESLYFGPANGGNVEVTVYGTPTTGDTLTITVENGAISGGESSATYTVTSSDTPMSIAAGLAAAINADTDLAPIGLTAANSSPGVFRWSQAFTASTPITSYSPTEMSGTDGSGNTGSVDYTMYVQGTTSYPTYDSNGNMTSDGTNTFTWDGENRLIQVTYPGVGNYSQFAYDGLDQCVQIVETVGGDVTTTKQFVWCDGKMREARDGDGDVLNQYFDCGQTISNSSYFYTKDHLGSIRELTDSSGNIQAQYEYDPYGRVRQVQGSLASDFQYANYYYHAPSGLNLAMHRAYSADLGRWLNRDPKQPSTEPNPFAYVENDPIGYVDPLGLAKDPCCGLSDKQKMQKIVNALDNARIMTTLQANFMLNVYGVAGTAKQVGVNPDAGYAGSIGLIVDKLMKNDVKAAELKDPCLASLLKMTNGGWGPDFYSPYFHVWWDVTTPGQWDAHVDNRSYDYKFGPGSDILYYTVGVFRP